MLPCDAESHVSSSGRRSYGPSYCTYVKFCVGHSLAKAVHMKLADICLIGWTVALAVASPLVLSRRTIIIKPDPKGVSHPEPARETLVLRYAVRHPGLAGAFSSAGVSIAIGPGTCG